MMSITEIIAGGEGEILTLPVPVEEELMGIVADGRKDLETI